MRRRTGWLLLALLGAAGPTAADEIQEYAKECDAHIGATVPTFSCLDGQVIPMTGTAGGTCDAPPYLPGAGCYPYSRIGQLVTPARVGIVFLCRHKALVSGATFPKYSDIAVIQTHLDTGATCFYQKLSPDGSESIDGTSVPAPSLGGFWMQPTVMRQKGNACVQCHDSGPFIRTPYLKPVAPDVFSTNRDKDQYYFPGNGFVGWNGQVFRVKIEPSNPGSACTSCHRMGSSDINPTLGTSAWLGLFSTGVNATPRLQNGLGPGGTHAVWMRPNVHTLDATNQQHSELVRDCATGTPVTGCTRTPFGGQVLDLLRQIEELTQGSARQP